MGVINPNTFQVCANINGGDSRAETSQLQASDAMGWFLAFWLVEHMVLLSDDILKES